MEIAKTILTIVYFIIALAMIILALIQTKEDGDYLQQLQVHQQTIFMKKQR